MYFLPYYLQTMAIEACECLRFRQPKIKYGLIQIDHMLDIRLRVIQNVKLFKIADSVLMNYITNYKIALKVLDMHDEDKSDLKGIYLSPE